MEQASHSMSFDEWAQAVDVLCRRHFACSWDDLAGDLEPLRNSFGMGETPREFIEWLARKFDLIWTDSVPLLSGTRLDR